MPVSNFLSSRGSRRAANSAHRQTASTAEAFIPTEDIRGPHEHNSMSSMRGFSRFEARRNMDESQLFVQRFESTESIPPIDFRMLDYVKEYDENLVCAICRCPFVDPVILTECDHAFCRDCIRQSWPDHQLGPRGNCPTCRTPSKLPARSSTSKIIVNILDDLEVHCPKHERGCTAIVKRGALRDHVTLYCGYGSIECLAEECTQTMLRKDSKEGCLHYPVSCIDCHQAMLKSELEQHWIMECPDRKVYCALCDSDVFYREYDQHSRDTCPAISMPCPGQDFGCTARSKRTSLEAHARDCALAKLAPFLQAQKQTLAEHETAQRQLSRKLELFEQGLSNLQRLLDPEPDSPDDESADERRIPFLSDHGRVNSFATARTSTLSMDEEPFHDVPIDLDTSFAEPRYRQATGTAQARSSRNIDSNFPPPASNGPYTSPIHHLLSLHESLRTEMTRISAAVSELDGRQSMQVLNENLRTREEIAYIGGQVAGMSRQVHWLTAAQLQRQQGRANGAPDASSREFGDASGAGAGAGVEAAVNAVASAASALRGAARIVAGSSDDTREGMTRRRTSDEGRTKL
ncbi:hypothetical protein AMS68_004153 [Peltaster fructicola]|uniref:RING-type domain-containing protein n=1 Tax=Peltaster fructicola TaxID=286661 RepID=A0A6H0XVC1_9PEZI|nr:hypothetical protein AMS68_004153 [Peltaster fructicola]